MPFDLCPECGGPAVDGLTCFEQLAAMGAWEYQDPELLALHFRTVASYNLQHPSAFTNETLHALIQVFKEAIDEDLGNAEVRRRMRRVLDVDGPTKVLRPEGARHPVLRRWELTISDVYLPDHPVGAAERVRAWSECIRRAL